MSSTQIALWLKYHDVILNNNTTKTNRYQMSLSLFLTVDNNTRSHLVIQILVQLSPINDLAADAAIRQVYLTIYLIYCIFYISKNLSKNLKFKLYN